MVFDTVVQRSVTLVPHGLRSRVKNLPLAGAVLRRLVNKRLNGRPFVHSVDAGPAKGITFELTLPEDKGIWTGNYEPAFAGRLAAEMRPGMVGYDVGAWHGYFCGIMLAGGASKVIAFEPLPANRERLKRLVELNRHHDLVIEPVALGDREGKADLFQMAATSMAKLNDSPFQPEHNTGGAISVEIKTLDGMLARGALPPPDIIKIDVEGAEGMVLKGAERTLATAKPIILAEIHSARLMREVKALLERHGYMVDEIDASELHREQDAGHLCAWV